jgi:catechol 2,3-dioxygenase-like lactoylglutathione lyase family enzyme
MNLLRIDHVQITVPWAREREARHFYGTVLGLRELERDDALHSAILCYAFGQSTQLHIVLVESPFRPPVSDHFAIVVDDMAAMKKRLAEHSVCYNPSPIRDGYQRLFIQDPFGNKMELIGGSDGGGFN